MSLDQYHVIRLLAEQTKSRSNEVALEGYQTPAPWDSVKWKDFDKISSQVAKVLIGLGFENQDKAVILSHNCPQWTCADVGSLKAKAVVVPIYPTSSQDQAEYIVNDAQAKLIFAGDASQYQT